MNRFSIDRKAIQSEKILALLREAGPRGVSKQFLIFELGLTQASARIFELESRGHRIRHEKRPGEHFVTFVLEPSADSPVVPGPAPSNPAHPTDWFETQTGKPRSGGDPIPDFELTP